MVKSELEQPADAPIATAPDLPALVSAYGGRLRRYFARWSTEWDADDLVQEVFLHLHTARPKAPIADIEAYLFTVAHHVLVSQHRRSTARRWRSHDPLERAPGAVNDLSPERVLLARQEYAAALRVMNDLPPRARAAFQLRRLESLSYAAIAERMGISRESVKDLLRRAGARVRRAGQSSSAADCEAAPGTSERDDDYRRNI